MRSPRRESTIWFLTPFFFPARETSGIVSVMGAAARRAAPGDIIIVCAYAVYEEKELAAFKPRLVYVDETNRITHTRNFIPVQVA